MATLIDGRPEAVDVLVRPGKAYSLELTWPDSLSGRTFTSTLGGASLTVSIGGDVMTVSATQAQIAALTDTTEWLLLEDIGGASPEPVLIGRWTPSEGAGSSTSSSVTVAESSSSVIVQHVANSNTPTPDPIEEKDVTELTGSDLTITTGGVLQLQPVPGATVDVPDSSRPHYVWAQAVLDFQAGGGTGPPASIGVAIAPTGSSALGNQIAFAAAHVADSGDLSSQTAWARIAPNDPRTLQMFVWADVGGDIRVRINNVSPPRIAAVQV